MERYWESQVLSDNVPSQTVDLHLYLALLFCLLNTQFHVRKYSFEVNVPATVYKEMQ